MSNRRSVTKRFCHLYRAPISRGGLFRYRNSIGLCDFYPTRAKEALNVVTCDIGQLGSWGNAFSDSPLLGYRIEDSQAFGFGNFLPGCRYRGHLVRALDARRLEDTQALPLLKYYCYEMWHVGLREIPELCTG